MGGGVGGLSACILHIFQPEQYKARCIEPGQEERVLCVSPFSFSLSTSTSYWLVHWPMYWVNTLNVNTRISVEPQVHTCLRSKDKHFLIPNDPAALEPGWGFCVNMILNSMVHTQVLSSSYQCAAQAAKNNSAHWCAGGNLILTVNITGCYCAICYCFKNASLWLVVNEAARSYKGCSVFCTL